VAHGYDYVNVAVAPGNVFGEGHEMYVDEGNPQALGTRRTFINEQSGPVKDWATFEAFPWPDGEQADLSTFDLFRPSCRRA